jgi:hypothetical protein
VRADAARERRLAQWRRKRFNPSAGDDDLEPAGPLSPEDRLESFLTAALVVHLEPGLDEEHAILAQLIALRGRYIADIAENPEDELAWIELLTDETLAAAAASLAEAWQPPEL